METPTRRRLLQTAVVGAGLFAAGYRGIAAAASLPEVTIGVLKYGTVSWELDTIRHYGFDSRAGIALKLVELAANQAAQVALQAGAVDLIVSDWMWVAKQRRAGEDLAFVPFSSAVGALVVPAESAIRGVADLKGKRIGVAGTPIDKSWLVLKAYAKETAGLDLDRDARPAFASPALLNEKVGSGEFDAVLNFWHYAARLEARGMRSVIRVDTMAEHFAGVPDVPAIGFVFRERWAGEHGVALSGLVKAVLDAQVLLAKDDAAWERLRPMMRAEDEAVFTRLRDGFRAGIPKHWGEAERRGAERLYRVAGGDEGGEVLPFGVFWPNVTY